VGRRPSRDAVISLLVPGGCSRPGDGISARADNGDFPGTIGVVAFAYADLGEGPGDGLRRPPLMERPVVGGGWSNEVCPGVGARSIPCLVGDAERMPAI
jgi:hypothetical protein